MFAFPKKMLPFARVAGRSLMKSPVVASRIPMTCAGTSSRSFAASTTSAKVANVLQAEIKHEDEQYEQAKEIKSFLKSSPFKFADTDGDVNMSLSREMGDRVVQIEWQLTSPFDPMADAEGEEENMEQEATDFCVTIENKSKGVGMSFYCSTQAGEEHRFVIGNLKMFANAEEKESASSFNGPEFEDLDDKVQESFDEYLAEAGLSSEVCDFIDAMALDKEQREYIRWLKTAKMFFES
jgi:complement component 1 Q subcomponent-binding protein|eukprot:TRINITY_DN164_c0_g1_i2.p1 TRINITY_DN164_c0_g1~~TRINITY_DN164_c0_g1_i2.p1  ORF type:complete len:261 (+),score=59.62 TRINITY_DN164_c0_g1_i2:71-784(+)